MRKYPQYKKVLFCTDFSETSDNAFDYAYGVAKRDKGELYILHVKPNVGNAKFVEAFIDKETLETTHKEYIKYVEDEHKEHYLKKIPKGTKCAVVSR
ncbi:MAG: universal stress protein, partial [Deltaproteobacteria bacterium]|nr:universal stress protein [Deltaproteobacteria bacterium]